MPGASSPRASNRTFQCGFSAESCPPRSTHTSPLASLAISRHPRSRRTRRTGRPLDVDRRAREGPRGRRGKTRSCGSRCPPPAHRNPRQYPSSCPPTLVSASLSASVARSRLLLWWWLAHGEVEGQLVGAAIGKVHPLAAVWAHQVGRPRTAAKGLDDLLLLGRHLFTLPQLCSISTRCADWPSTISQTTWGAMPLGISAGRSPRRSPPDPRPPAPGAARGARSARAPRSADCPAADARQVAVLQQVGVVGEVTNQQQPRSSRATDQRR